MDNTNLDNNFETQIIGEPEVIMTMDSNGRSTPIAACLMVARKVQGRPYSKLMKVLLGPRGSKSMFHRTTVPRGARITEAPSKTLMNTLAGTYAPLGKITMEGLRLPSFERTGL